MERMTERKREREYDDDMWLREFIFWDWNSHKKVEESLWSLA